MGGRTADRAYWQASEIEWIRASNGRKDITPVSPQELEDWFGQDQIITGEVRSTPFWLAWDSAFHATLRIRYSVTPTFNHYTAPSSVDCRDVVDSTASR
jgi:hypothetical protein